MTSGLVVTSCDRSTTRFAHVSSLAWNDGAAQGTRDETLRIVPWQQAHRHPLSLRRRRETRYEAERVLPLHGGTEGSVLLRMRRN